jgi:hypothetical protein
VLLERARVIATTNACKAAWRQGSKISAARFAPKAMVDGVGEPVDLAILA